MSAEKTLAPHLLHILQHSLGVDAYGQGRQYRNHYVAGGDDVALCRELANLGYMKERAATQLSGGDPWFNVTDEGIDAVALFSPEAPPPPKRTQFDEYLDYDSCDSFGQWLLGNKMPEFEQRGSWGNYEHRMFRCRYSRREVEVKGEWCKTQKAAKASYKEALKKHRAAAREMMRECAA